MSNMKYNFRRWSIDWFILPAFFRATLRSVNNRVHSIKSGNLTCLQTLFGFFSSRITFAASNLPTTALRVISGAGSVRISFFSFNKLERQAQFLSSVGRMPCPVLNFTILVEL